MRRGMMRMKLEQQQQLGMHIKYLMITTCQNRVAHQTHSDAIRPHPTLLCQSAAATRKTAKDDNATEMAAAEQQRRRWQPKVSVQHSQAGSKVTRSSGRATATLLHNQRHFMH